MKETMASVQALCGNWDLGKVRLISNNPVKRAGLEGYGIKIVETIPLIIESNPHNRFYLETKANKMGHDLSCYKHVAND